MELFKIITQVRGFKVFPLILLGHIIFMMISIFLAVKFNYFSENIYLRLMLYQILAGIIAFIIIFLLAHQSKDDKILNLMALVWLQGTGLFLDLTILFSNQFSLTNLFLFLVGIFIFVISIGLTGGFSEYLSIGYLDEYYGQEFFGGLLSPLSGMAYMASLILFIFLVYLNECNFLFYNLLL